MVRRAVMLIGVGFLLAIAIGAIEVPNVADAMEDVTAPLGVWIHLVVVAFVFFETTVLLGFVIHGELVLMLSGVAASRGDASLTMPFVAGSAGMTVRRLVPVSAASALVWTATFTLIGYAVAESFVSAGQVATRITSAAIVLATAAFVIHTRVSRRRATDAPPHGGEPATGCRPAA